MMKMNRYFWLLLVGVFVLGGASAYADMLELRVGAGITAADFDSLDSQIGQTNSSVSSDDIQNFNVDLMWNIPVSPINVGLRYEVANQDQSGGSIANSDFASWDLDVSKVVGLVDFRFVDNVVYLGSIAGLGFATSDFKSNINGATTDSNLDGMNYLIGIEGGAHLGMFIAGAEVGYEGLKLDAPTGFSGDVDLSGVYGKIMVGISFL